jgi:hypothetical protein
MMSILRAYIAHQFSYKMFTLEIYQVIIPSNFRTPKDGSRMWGSVTILSGRSMVFLESEMLSLHLIFGRFSQHLYLIKYYLVLNS